MELGFIHILIHDPVSLEHDSILVLLSGIIVIEFNALFDADPEKLPQMDILP